jgi:hypothetical protein
VLRLEFQGELPENGRNFLSERLIQGLAAADFQVFAGLTVQQLIKQGEALESCRSADCYRKIAVRLGVEYLVTGTIDVEQKNYQLALELVSGRDGKSVGQSRETCELCGIREAGQLMDRQVLGLREFAAAAAAAAPARYAIETNPAGAEVTIDGKSAGQTPLSVDVPAGSHKVALHAPGRDTLERSLEVESGTDGVLKLDLAPEPGSESGAALALAHRQQQLRTYGLIALGAGVIAGVAGAIELSLNGTHASCSDCGADEHLDRKTSIEAAAFLGASGTLLAAGGLLLYLGWGDGHDQPGAAPAAQAARPWLVGARGTF